MIVQRFWPDLGITAKVAPIAVARHDGHLLDGKTILEHLADSLVPEIVEVEVGDAQLFARLREILGHGLWVDREDALI